MRALCPAVRCRSLVGRDRQFTQCSLELIGSRAGQWEEEAAAKDGRPGAGRDPVVPGFCGWAPAFAGETEG